jgi:hypothetical protein
MHHALPATAALQLCAAVVTVAWRRACNHQDLMAQLSQGPRLQGRHTVWDGGWDAAKHFMSHRLPSILLIKAPAHLAASVHAIARERARVEFDAQQHKLQSSHGC